MKKNSCLSFFLLLLIIFNSCYGAFNRQPEIPTGLSASGPDNTALNGQIIIRWNEAKNAGLYYIYRAIDNKEGPYEYIGQSAISEYVDIDNFTEDSLYYYKISAVSVYGDKESPLSEESAAGWIRRRLWEEIAPLAVNAKQLKTIINPVDSTLYYVYADLDNILHPGLLSLQINPEIQDTENNQSQNSLEYKQYQAEGLDFASLAADKDPSFRLAFGQGNLFMAFLDAEVDNQLSLVRIEAASPDQNATLVNAEQINWQSTTMGQKGFSNEEVYSFDMMLTGTRAYCAWISKLPDQKPRVSFFDLNGGLIWENLPNSGLPDFKNARVFLQNIAGRPLLALLDDQAIISFYQLNSQESEWLNIAPDLDVTENPEKIQFSMENFQPSISYHITSEIFFYTLINGSWLPSAPVLTSLANQKSAFDINLQNAKDILYLNENSQIVVKSLQINPDNPQTSSWDPFGRNAVDAELKGLISESEGQYLNLKSSPLVYYAAWINQNSIHLSILR